MRLAHRAWVRVLLRRCWTAYRRWAILPRHHYWAAVSAPSPATVPYAAARTELGVPTVWARLAPPVWALGHAPLTLRRGGARFFKWGVARSLITHKQSHHLLPGFKQAPLAGVGLGARLPLAPLGHLGNTASFASLHRQTIARQAAAWGAEGRTSRTLGSTWPELPVLGGPSAPARGGRYLANAVSGTIPGPGYRKVEAAGLSAIALRAVACRAAHSEPTSAPEGPARPVLNAWAGLPRRAALLQRLAACPAMLWTCCAAVFPLAATLLVVASLLTLFLERKFIAIAQKRLGASFLGRNGWMHLVADVLKFFLKQTNRHPASADFLPAGFLGVLVAYFSWSCLACLFFPTDGGSLLFDYWDYQWLSYLAYAALTTLFLHHVVVGTRSKYATVAGLRLLAVSVFLEVFFVACFLVLSTHVGGYSLDEIIEANSAAALPCALPPLALLFFIYVLFEAKRAPFDQAEAESELVSGHNVEFGGKGLLLFYLTEYSHCLGAVILVLVVVCGGGVLPQILGLNTVWAEFQGFEGGRSPAWERGLPTLVTLGLAAGWGTWGAYVWQALYEIACGTTPWLAGWSVADPYFLDALPRLFDALRSEVAALTWADLADYLYFVFMR